MSSAADIQRGLQFFAQAQALHREQKFVPAAEAFRRAMALMPNHPQVIAGYAQLALDVKDWVAAEKLLRMLITVRPQVDVDAQLGVALFHQQKYDQAVSCLQKHIGRRPDDADVLHALANSLCSLGRWEEGLVHARQAYALKPDGEKIDPVLNTLFHLGRVEELDRQLDDAMQRFPDSRPVRSMFAMHRLKRGDYASGMRHLQDFRWRHHPHTPPDGGTPGEWWNGTHFDGTLLITAEQGLGDELMVSSMYEDLVAMGQRALVECDERLLPLYRRTFPALDFVARHRQNLQKAFAAGGSEFRKLNGLDLAALFRNGSDRFPARHRWLTPDPERVAALRDEYRARWPGRKLVGLSWKSSRMMEGQSDKSIDLAEFSPLMQREDTAFISLQYGKIREEIDSVRSAGLGEVFLDENIDATDDIDGLAAQIAALDAVVSTSNTTVHIAGALGVPCLVLLPRTRPVLWYWGYAGVHTPWYPSLSLLRNESEIDREALIRHAGAALSGLLQKPGP